MKSLTINYNGTFSFVMDDLEGTSDTSNPNLHANDVQKIQDVIDTMAANDFKQMHFEKSEIAMYVHKVGMNRFEEESNPDAYDAFATLEQWGHDVSDD